MRPASGIRGAWEAMRADPERARQPAASRARAPVSARAQAAGGDGLPDWLARLAAPRGTGGHRATAAEKRAAYALFAAKRAAVAGRAGRHSGVFASMRGADDVSPLARRIFGLGQ